MKYGSVPPVIVISTAPSVVNGDVVPVTEHDTPKGNIVSIAQLLAVDIRN
jgi:hypothetical protein